MQDGEHLARIRIYLFVGTGHQPPRKLTYNHTHGISSQTVVAHGFVIRMFRFCFHQFVVCKRFTVSMFYFHIQTGKTGLICMSNASDQVCF